MSLATAIAQKIGTSTSWVGTVTATDPFTVDGIPAQPFAGQSPLVGDHGLVVVSSGVAYYLGALPGYGLPRAVAVTAVADGSGMVACSDSHGRTYLLQIESGQTAAVGQLRKVDWSTTKGLLGPVVPAIPGDPLPPVPGPGIESGRTVLTPIVGGSSGSGSWRGSSWDTTAVGQGDYGFGEWRGAYFYGGQTAALAGVTITSASIYLARGYGGDNYSGGSVARLWHHTSNYRPAGDVVRDAGPHDLTVPLGANTYALGLNVAQALPGGGGIAFQGAAYMKFPTSDPNSGRVEVLWTRG